ncbi:tRNA (adenosine(37)-N6)-threonylcarbamoyltransferase complex ATPase subunit type 1 TsaE [Candidatus Saccharibacteria bacterium]|nr:tRNA (adenosine(37)-N6)-threonylcarbamoyltransferase complex ATPase subunit type 1 TsaE [Candidatus Saccharibacteria bacterium]
MNFTSEPALADFAESLGVFLSDSKHLPLCIELVGNVGAGKTTFTRYLAKGLGVKAPITSPSFTISKHYFFAPKLHERSARRKCDSHRGDTSIDEKTDFELVHYDFYRLDDPGLMADDLAESLSQKNTLTVLEWADSVKDLLPKDHLRIAFKVQEDGTRHLSFNAPMQSLLEQLRETK